MKNNTVSSVLMLQIDLPSRIIVPADCDLNALFAFMRRASIVENVTEANDELRQDYGNYIGPDTCYRKGAVVPEVKDAPVVYASKAEAQAAKNQIVRDEIAEREASKAERAARLAKVAAAAEPKCSDVIAAPFAPDAKPSAF